MLEPRRWKVLIFTCNLDELHLPGQVCGGVIPWHSGLALPTVHHAAHSAMSKSNSSLPGMNGHGARSAGWWRRLTVLTVTATSHVIHFDLLLESTEGGDDGPRTSN